MSAASRAAQPDTFAARLRYFLTPLDGRYEDLLQGSVGLNVVRDLTAGLIVAMVAIPLAMGFAMASGLPPVMGIVGGAVAGPRWLEMVPMACIGGILLFVAVNMVKPAEVKEVWHTAATSSSA